MQRRLGRGWDSQQVTDRKQITYQKRTQRGELVADGLDMMFWRTSLDVLA